MPMVEEEDPWSGDEVLALLRIRSTMENWFPDFVWEHVSRKLADIGYKRAPEKCRDKFEEESKYFNNMNSVSSAYSKMNYMVFGDVEELNNEGDEDPHRSDSQGGITIENKGKPSFRGKSQEVGLQDSDRNQLGIEFERDERDSVAKTNGRKRKRSSLSGKKFELFKGFCEVVVQKILTQQEEMHAKLLVDMVRRDLEKAAREEEWKRQEMDRIDKELELRAHEQVLARDRQDTIIRFLNMFTSSSIGSSSDIQEQRESHDAADRVQATILDPSPSPEFSSLILAPDQNHLKQFTPPLPNQPSSSPSDFHHAGAGLEVGKSLPSVELQSDCPTPGSPTSVQNRSSSKDNSGKRWPKDEVLALINLRCSLFNRSEQDKEGGLKAPVWERISQGMQDLGYKRNSKRCKEKWENINKYFRKTKDMNKKRPVNSRTCPYFHQLNAWYSQGPVSANTEGFKSCPESPENC